MQLIINSTDTIDALIVARNTINDILARRAPPIEKQGPQQPEQQAPAPIQQDAAKATGVTEPAPAPEKKTKPKVAKAVSADEVRAVMVAKSAEGKKQQVVALLASMGFDKLSQVPPERLVELKTMVEAL